MWQQLGTDTESHSQTLGRAQRVLSRMGRKDQRNQSGQGHHKNTAHRTDLFITLGWVTWWVGLDLYSFLTTTNSMTPDKRLRSLKSPVIFFFLNTGDRNQNISWTIEWKSIDACYRRKKNEGDNYMQIIKPAYQLWKHCGVVWSSLVTKAEWSHTTRQGPPWAGEDSGYTHSQHVE